MHLLSFLEDSHILVQVHPEDTIINVPTNAPVTEGELEGLKNKRINLSMASDHPHPPPKTEEKAETETK